MLRLDSSTERQAFIDQNDCFLLDCDGVIWVGSTLIPNVKETIMALKALGKQIIFVTNNASKSRATYQERFASMGISADVREIFGSAFATATHMQHIIPADKKVFVVGMKGLTEELDACNMPDAHCPSMAMLDYQPDPSVGAVVLGFDLDITYHKLARAATHLSDPKCLFFATNSDASFPANGRLYPGTGAILAALQTGSGRTATVIGKPNSLMLDLIVAKYKCDKSRTVMIGDRLDTDILFGKQGGVKTCLVMTGVTRPETIAVGMAIEPDYVIDSLGSLMA